MLRTLNDLEQFKVAATDGDIGSIESFLLDDEQWAIRYLVVDTFEFLDGRHVLIPPISFRQVDWPERRFQLNLSMGMIEHCPGTDADLPVSRQDGDEINRHYGYPSYWAYSELWGLGGNPELIAAKREEVAEARAVAVSEQLTRDIHLRSTKELRGYHILGNGEDLGHIEDFVVDDESWAIRFLVIDTSNWWFGKKVLVVPQLARRIDWVEKVVHLDLSREALQGSPEWDPSLPPAPLEVARVPAAVDQPSYWTGGAPGKP